MTIIIYVSKSDKASNNIKESLFEKADWRESGEFQGKKVYENGIFKLISGSEGERHIEQNGLDKELFESGIDPDYIVFPSRHSSDNNRKLLSIHTPGNLGNEAKVGGNPKEVSMSAPNLIKHGVRKLKELSEETDYKTSLEATHHGPSNIDTPTIFIEIGSSREEWMDPEAGEIVAETILSLRNKVSGQDRLFTGVSVGGGHYAPEQTRLLLETNIALGHIMPRYSLDLDMLREIIDKTPRCSFIHITNELDVEQKIKKSINLPVYNEGYIRDLSPLEPSIWREIIDKAPDKTRPVYSGDTNIEKLKLVEINQELIKTTEKTGSDGEKLKICLEDSEFVYYKRDNGTITNKFLIPSKGFKDRIEKFINCAIKIIGQQKPIEVTREEGYLSIEITQKKFNPERAMSLGLEKRQFSELSGGSEVEVEGKTITPDMVHNINKKEINVNYPPKVLDIIDPG